MKEKLSNVLGAFGMILYYVVHILATVMPVAALSVPFIWAFLIFLIESIFPPVSFIVWLIGLILTIIGKQDTFAIVYYIMSVIILLPFYIDTVISIFTKKD